MPEPTRGRACPGPVAELLVITLAGWIALASVPLILGQIGISWDALNHHIYLGWTASQSRFELDYMAASYQTYQFPYLYWPVYKLAASGASGAWAGVALATLSSLAIPALWMISRRSIPDQGWYGLSMRLLAVLLGFLSPLVLSMLDSTSNDLLASVPLIWAVALAVEALPRGPQPEEPAGWIVMLSGLLAGVSVACKLSNGPLAVVMPILWLWGRRRLRARLRLAVLGCAAAGTGFALAYGYWGWALWTHFGNPVHPFYDGLFAPLRQLVGWHR